MATSPGSISVLTCLPSHHGLVMSAARDVTNINAICRAFVDVVDAGQAIIVYVSFAFPLRHSSVAFFQSVECQRSHWPEHKPHCDETVAGPTDAALSNVLQQYPNMERDCRHFTAAITPRLSEATIRALDLPRYPDNRSKFGLCLGVIYDPDGPRDVQRFKPKYCHRLSLTDLVQGNSDSWKRTVDDLTKADDHAIRVQNLFGAALMLIVFIAPQESVEDSPFDRPFLVTVETLQITHIQSKIHGDTHYANDMLMYLRLLKESGSMEGGE